MTNDRMYQLNFQSVPFPTLLATIPFSQMEAPFDAPLPPAQGAFWAPSRTTPATVLSLPQKLIPELNGNRRIQAQQGVGAFENLATVRQHRMGCREWDARGFQAACWSMVDPITVASLNVAMVIGPYIRVFLFSSWYAPKWKKRGRQEWFEINKCEWQSSVMLSLQGSNR